MHRLRLTFSLLGMAFICSVVPGWTSLAPRPAVTNRHTGSINSLTSRPDKTRSLERVILGPDGHGFILQRSHRVFHPWGVNYGNKGRLVEDFWTRDWPTVEDDFHNIKALGYNVVRVHLQFGKYMISPKSPNPASLDQLGRLLQLAEKTGLYLDLTGLACYRKADVPPWYDALSEEERWAAQARFWQTIAGRCARSPAVFCYDLINEPLVPGAKRSARQWYSGSSLGGYDFLQFVALDPGTRSRAEIADEWIRSMTRAIRSRDHVALITVGLLPWTPELGFLSGFEPQKVAPELDFVSVHIYPAAGKVPEALDVLNRFAVGKPVVIEETFPLSCSADDLESFLLQSRRQAVGWLGHFDGVTIEAYEKKRRAGTLTIGDAIWESWLELSLKIKPELVRSDASGNP